MLRKEEEKYNIFLSTLNSQLNLQHFECEKNKKKTLTKNTANFCFLHTQKHGNLPNHGLNSLVRFCPSSVTLISWGKSAFDSVNFFFYTLIDICGAVLLPHWLGLRLVKKTKILDQRLKKEQILPKRNVCGGLRPRFAQQLRTVYAIRKYH